MINLKNLRDTLKNKIDLAAIWVLGSPYGSWVLAILGVFL